MCICISQPIAAPISMCATVIDTTPRRNVGTDSKNPMKKTSAAGRM